MSLTEDDTVVVRAVSVYEFFFRLFRPLLKHADQFLKTLIDRCAGLTGG